MIKLKIPSSEVVSGLEVRQFLKLSSTAFDTQLDSFATSARLQAEDFTRRAFITQTWQKTLDYTEIQDAIKLPRPPLQSITSVIVYDDAGTPTTVDPATVYTYDNFSEPGWLMLRPSASWPYCRDYNGMLVEYVCGYGPVAANVPMPIRMAILETAAHSWVNGKLSELPEDAISKLKPYRVYL